ncbi:hypothetical protein [Nitrosospira sp. NRS527]|uniref:hypothetical protein n=1 Tax=Nitrosospira sp. NRS527 TaxID=155925 RepID=UPI001AF2948E|nr:hypothetical protein [Nitrosospira sp. NRS527]BCT68165.1 hypothetical protein NNRS527_01757 [Nitrosospira sp. NRS527]
MATGDKPTTGIEEQEETLALLKILALGNREIEQGHFLSANDVFDELGKEDAQ